MIGQDPIRCLITWLFSFIKNSIRLRTTSLTRPNKIKRASIIIWSHALPNIRHIRLIRLTSGSRSWEDEWDGWEHPPWSEWSGTECVDSHACSESWGIQWLVKHFSLLSFSMLLCHSLFLYFFFGCFSILRKGSGVFIACFALSPNPIPYIFDLRFYYSSRRISHVRMFALLFLNSNLTYAGVSGLIFGGITGVLRSPNPAIHSIAAGIHWFAFGTSSWCKGLYFHLHLKLFYNSRYRNFV